MMNIISSSLAGWIKNPTGHILAQGRSLPPPEQYQVFGLQQWRSPLVYQRPLCFFPPPALSFSSPSSYPPSKLLSTPLVYHWRARDVWPLLEVQRALQRADTEARTCADFAAVMTDFSLGKYDCFGLDVSGLIKAPRHLDADGSCCDGPCAWCHGSLTSRNYSRWHLRARWRANSSSFCLFEFRDALLAEPALWPGSARAHSVWVTSGALAF